MGAAFFYHLTQSPLESTLPLLLQKARGAGWNIAVKAQDAARLDWLDQRLWQGQPDGFLPHGVAGGEHDALQPILLTLDDALPNAAQCIMSIDGAQVSAETVQAAERVCILFDGYDDSAVAHARLQWKALTEAGCAAQYWSEESGNWEKKAEKSA
ncbi:DNA polymerase III subunit chi [Cognatishimia sp. WU-CL00825]|uniref:DNA polymerase III subunit chi n=1 Tax=Cognatishimia sp. WU-CL00825 TaxID=3127658 RepID=UPI0031055B3E